MFLKPVKYYLYHPTGRLTLLKFLITFAIVGIVLAYLAVTIVFAIFSVDLPDPNRVIRRDGYSTIIYDRNGKTLYDVYNKEHRIPLEIADIPKDLQRATVAIEDRNFYNNRGFDPLSPLRILKTFILERKLIGGSGLTQQLVKNVLLTSERSITRKIKEAILAHQIDQKFSKEQILQMYLNEAPYGGATYGVESAAQTYFNKHAKDLSLVESAIIAGMPQLPTIYSPFGSTPKAYIGRTKDVLRRMNEDGYITKQQEADAIGQLENVRFASISAGIKAPHFVFYVKDQLVKMFGSEVVETGGLRVTTSLDFPMHERAEKIVNEEILKIKKLKVGNGASVILNAKTGEILSMVGSYDYFAKDYDGNVNVATSLRQPGSSGKPFIYAAALMNNYTPASVLMDVKTEFPSGDPKNPIYTPNNYDGKFRGAVQMRFSLGNSLNIPAVKMTALVSVKEVMNFGYKAGITTWEPTPEIMKNVGLSLALGGREVRLLELTSAYGIFANEGYKTEPISILKVTDPTGKKLFESRSIQVQRVISPEVSFLISHILSDDNSRKETFGAGSLLTIPNRTVAVKTGTTDLKRDNWTVGYTPSTIVGVWVGNNDNSIMDPKITSGVTGASPIWNKLMRLALEQSPKEEFKKPDDVEAVEIDAIGGGLPYRSNPKRVEYFIKGTEPISIAPIYHKLKVSKANGKLANDLELKLGDFEEKEFIVISESDPISDDGKNRWQDGINAWINENQKDNQAYKSPTEKSDNLNNAVIIRISEPSDHQKLDSNDVVIRGKAFSMRDIVRFQMWLDDVEKINKASDTLDESLSIPDGAHKFKFQAVDSAGNSSESEIRIGIRTEWDASPPVSP